MHDATVSELSPEEATDLVVRTIQANADVLLRVARKHSLCADDAQDAYQRALEIFMRRVTTVRVETAGAWLRTVVKHEAMAIRASRLQLVGAEDVDMDAHEAGHLASPEEQLLSFDVVTRSAEALQRLKPQEVRALWLKAAGHSYTQIAESTGWTYTKVNRCIAEGRKSFLARYASIESGEECDRWAPVVSAMIDGEATAQQVLDARPHLRNCPACKAMMREADRQRASFGVLFGVAVGGGEGGPAVPAPDAGGLLARAYEAIASAVHERAVASAVKVQAALDAATAGKVAAVAASAAAVAGGGVAVVDNAVVQREPDHRKEIAHRAPAAARAALATAVAGRDYDRVGGGTKPAAQPRSATSREFASSGGSGSSRQVSNEFGSPRKPGARAASASSRPATPAAAPAVRRPGQVDAEFGP